MSRLADLQGPAADLFAEYGMLALFGVFVIEGAMLLYFAPSESLVPAAVLLAKQSTAGGEFVVTVAAILGVAVVGATIGQFALFTIAKRKGREWLFEQSWFRIGESRIERFEGWFDRWGAVAVLVSNALLFTRGMLTVPAGFAEMEDRTFIVVSAVGTLIFEAALAALTLGVLEYVV